MRTALPICLDTPGEKPPPFPFPPPGESRGGRVPPTPEARREPANNAGTHRAAGSPHKRAAAPLCIPRWASRPSASGEVNDERLEERRKTGAVYTKYLTLPSTKPSNPPRRSIRLHLHVSSF